MTHARRPRQQWRTLRRILVTAVAASITAVLLMPGIGPPFTHSGPRLLPGYAAKIAGTFFAPKSVFALYFPPYPVSLDNLPPQSDYYATQYLQPNGESGKHAYCGGLLRDRPIPRSPRSGNWRLADLQDEVRTAKKFGLDGFTIDILTKSSNPEWVTQVPALLLTAAHNVDPSFKIMLMPDMSGELASLTQDELASDMMKLASYPSAFRLGDGRLVLSPFLAEAHDAPWWSVFLNIMANQYKTPVAFVPQFLNSSPYIDSFTPFTYGMAEWGGRSPQFTPISNTQDPDVQHIHNNGMLWMQPVSVQDERPNQSIYDEAVNTTNLRATWMATISNQADWVQLNTWNDYSEGTSFAPSVKHGTAFLKASQYYMRKYKTGKQPAINGDLVVLTHRTQLTNAPTSFQESQPMVLRDGSGPVSDAVEALTFLAVPADVTVTVGSNKRTCKVPAGVSVCTLPLAQPSAAGDSVSARVTRLIFGFPMTFASVTSPNKVIPLPYVQDLQYVAAVN
ncbi:hypothetical protein ABIA30_001936 [Mycobacterium sp. MAA66]|uniref:glycoside hydrolase family 71 protein n=1 Tax=Mycobacterium sp. MAA66 TaxID=3156297 RepID=UPI003510DBD2